ncbi:hypothetical protein ACP4OV_027261 [Aristida adscensionis]
MAAAAAVHGGGGGGGGCGRRRGAVDEGARVGRPRRGHRGAPSPRASGEGELHWPPGRGSSAGRRGGRAPLATVEPGSGGAGLRHRRGPQGWPRAPLRPRPPPQPPLPQIDDKRGGGG